MNFDCQFAILEKLDVQSLMMVAQINSYYKDLASDVFKRKHSHKTINIPGSFVVDSTNSIDDRGDKITIKNFEMVQMMLRTFGPLIHSIELNLRFIESDQRKVIHHQISEFCSESLLSIVLNDLKENQLEEFTAPLKKVEDVTVTKEFLVSDGEFKVTNVFPAVRRLNLKHVNEIDHFIVDVTIPTLEEVEVTFPFANELRSSLQTLFKKNPQIRKVKLGFWNSMYYLEFTNKFLPNLEDLLINFNNQDHIPDSEIRFENVKILTTSTNGQKTNYFKVIKFNNLKELDLTCHADECLDFTEENKDVTKLKISAQAINDKQVLKIGNVLEQLTEFYIKNEIGIKADTIIELIHERTQLKKLHLHLPGEALYETLKLHLPRQWEITQEGGYIFMKKSY